MLLVTQVWLHLLLLLFEGRGLHWEHAGAGLRMILYFLRMTEMPIDSCILLKYYRILWLKHNIWLSLSTQKVVKLIALTQIFVIVYIRMVWLYRTLSLI